MNGVNDNIPYVFELQRRHEILADVSDTEQEFYNFAILDCVLIQPECVFDCVLNQMIQVFWCVTSGINPLQAVSQDWKTAGMIRYQLILQFVQCLIVKVFNQIYRLGLWFSE